jgi:hypothetical protein
VEEKDRQKFLEDFQKTDITKKLDMWYYALDQIAFWEEILAEMSGIANLPQPMQKMVKKNE